VAALVSSRDLSGKLVVSQDGRIVGEIESVEVATESWRVLGFHVKVKREALEDMRLKKPMMGTQTVLVAPDQVSGIEDVCVLRSALAAVEHTGGKPVKE
jgi:sporulation protein YlmC with PRC-barrel domain